jgi:peptide/nickel transport system permease protein
MVSFIIKRIFISLLVIWLISIIVFLIIHLLPGDPVLIMLGEGAPPEQVSALRAQLNLDKPIVDQYLYWIAGVLKGDFGKSVQYSNIDIGKLLRDKLLVTLSITVPALLISIFVGIVSGTISAIKRGSAGDQVVTVLSTAGIGIPSFWISIFMIFLFGVYLAWLPLQGYTSPFENFGEFLLKSIMPVICTSISFVAAFTRQTRSHMLEVLNQDYIRTARANGIPENRVIYIHAIKNAAIPLVTLISLSFRMLVGGSILIEKIFNIPGLGLFAINSLLKRDYPCVQAVTLIVATITVLGNLLTDIIYGVLDPRIRERRSS